VIGRAAGWKEGDRIVVYRKRWSILGWCRLVGKIGVRQISWPMLYYFDNDRRLKLHSLAAHKLLLLGIMIASVDYKATQKVLVLATNLSLC
jgi:hypothetical protein